MATLKVTVHEARDLPVMNRTTGLADLYVVLKLDDVEYTTEIAPRTRHPVWNCDYRFTTSDLFVLQEDPLEVRVYDQDIISRDDIVGTVLIDCNCILYRDSPILSGWFPLFDTNEGIHGDIRLTIRIKFAAAQNPLAPTVPERYVQRPRGPDPRAFATPAAVRHGWPSGLSATGLYPSDPTLPTSGNFLTPAAHARPGRDDETGAAATTSSALLPPPPALWPCLVEHDLEPIQPVQAQHPTISAEEEGVHIFSAWRLDPSVHRVELVRSMVEELIVKADPEHSRLTNLRSVRTTNEARLVQLFKLSGKVRRQLARKVVEMRCNAVLGYVEEFDMEPNGIIVRAYGTPCVISTLCHVDERRVLSLLKSRPQLLLDPVVPPSLSLGPRHGAASATPQPSAFVDSVESAAGHGDDAALLLLRSPAALHHTLGPPSLSDPSALATPMLTAGVYAGSANASLHSLAGSPGLAANVAVGRGAHVEEVNALALPPPMVSAVGVGAEATAAPGVTRAAVLILTVKDLPSGCIHHMGGHICARSVKIVSRVKSRQVISQERDAWWMELREELRANARAFHCNAILGYEEEIQYQEDVALLSLHGTAVILDAGMTALRAGPDHLFRATCERVENKRSCALVHLYHSSRRKPALTLEVGELMHRRLCNECRHRAVPEVLLATCNLPCELRLEGVPRLVHVTVAKTKPATKGVGLATAVSQALPYVEFALHRQLLFQLRLMQLNACFGLRVSIVLGPGTIIGSLTGTGCRLAALPVPTAPRIEVVDPLIARKETVMRLKNAVTRHRRGGRHHASASSSSSTSRGSSRASSSAGSTSGGSSASRSPSSRRRPTTTRHRRGGGSSASATSSSSADADDALGSWCSSSSSERGTEALYQSAVSAAGRTKMSEFVVKVDDEEEADMMLGMVDDAAVDEGLLFTIPYLAESAHGFDAQERLILNRRYDGRGGEGAVRVGAAAVETPVAAEALSCVTGAMTTRRLNRCCADAKRAFVVQVGRLARRLGPLTRVRVVGFRVDPFFETNSGDLQLRLEGCVLLGGVDGVARVRALQERAFRTCLCGVAALERASSAPTRRDTALVHEAAEFVRHDLGASPPAAYRHARTLFLRSSAPFSLPFVMDHAVPALHLWSGGAGVEREGVRPGPTTHGTLSGTAFVLGEKTTTEGAVGRKLRTLLGATRGAMQEWVRTARGWHGGQLRAVRARRHCGRRADSHEDAGAQGVLPLHEPTRRLPANLEQLAKIAPDTVFTPLDYVVGQAVVRYLGRLSQHFIREAYDINTAAQLGVFYQNTALEVQWCVQALVHLMGGNALLQHRVVYHEVFDSDGAGCAFLFVTVTGDVVQTTATARPESDHDTTLGRFSSSTTWGGRGGATTPSSARTRTAPRGTDSARCQDDGSPLTLQT